MEFFLSFLLFDREKTDLAAAGPVGSTVATGPLLE